MTERIEVNLPGVSLEYEVPAEVKDSLEEKGDYEDLRRKLQRHMDRMEDDYQPPSLRILAEDILEKVEKGQFEPEIRHLLTEEADNSIQKGLFEKYGKEILEETDSEDIGEERRELFKNGLIPFKLWKQYVSESIHEYDGPEVFDREKLYETAQFEA